MNWPKAKAGEVLSDVKSGEWGAADPNADTVPVRVVRGTDFLQAAAGRLTGVPIRYVRTGRYESRRLQPGDLLIEMSGGSENQATGRALLVTESLIAAADYPISYSNFVKRVRPPESLDPEFVWLQWQHLYQRGRTRIYERRTTGIRNFKLDAFLENEDFVIPPVEEQRTIAHVLRTAQRAKQQTEQVIAAAQELKRSLLTHLFTLGLVSPSDGPSCELADTEIGRMPAHWSVVALGSVATLASGGTPSKQRADWWSGPVPWASPKDIKTSRLRDTQDHITLEAAHENSRVVPPGTLLVVIRGMILAKDVPVALTDVPMALNQDLKAVVPKPEVDAEFLLYALQRAKPRLRREIGTSAHGTRRIGTQALERLLIPFPPRDEQRRIAQALAAVDRKIGAEEERRDALRTLFDSLLHGLMTARLRVDGLAAEFV